MEHDLRPRKEPVAFLDHPVIVFFARVMDCFILTILWALCSLPIITIGASTAAMYHTTMKLVRGETAKTVRTFFRGFRLHWKRATLTLPILLVVFAIALGDFLALMTGMLPVPAKWFNIIFAIPIPLALMFCSYVLPMTVYFDDKMGDTLQKCVFAIIRNIPVALLATLLNWSAPMWLYADWESFVKLILPVTLLLPGAVAYINSLMFNKVFEKHIAPSDFDDTDDDF